jgi:4-amino-4-deoxy-L-arabinose transferase-like glycosyltransferase
MLYYSIGRKGASLKLYGLSYTLMAAAYLMKGLPPIVFQFFTLVGWAVFMKDWKLLFHRTHFLGVLFFIVPVGFYYYLYLQVNPGSAETVFTTIFNESSKRTVTDHSWLQNVKTVFLFPFENLYHFAPWTILVASLFVKGVASRLWSDDFSRFAILIFAFNILVYWTSPGVHPRYLFMFLPLFFALLFEATGASGERMVKRLQYIIFAAMLLALAVPIAAGFFVESNLVPSFYSKLIVTFIGLLIASILYYRKALFRWEILGIFLLILRIGFDWMILPNRDAAGRLLQEDAERVVAAVGTEPLYLRNASDVHDATSFVISSQREQILTVADSLENNTFYIVHENYFNPEKHLEYLQFKTNKDPYHLYLIKLK